MKKIDKKKLAKYLLFMLLAVTIFLYINKPHKYGPYYVNYIFDGDTIAVQIDDKNVRVRLIGIDCPELKIDEIDNISGIEAKVFVEQLLKDKKVYLEYDKQKKDNYGRTLAYVYLEDNRMLNRLILANGHAKLLYIEPNDAHRFELELIYYFNNLINIFK